MPLMATLPLLGVWALAVLSPGPDFLAVLRTSAGRSRRSGLLVAAGVVTGIAVWAVAGMLGVTLLIARFAWLYTAVRIAGALFLIGFGIATLRSVRRGAPLPPADGGPAPAAERAVALRAWRLGLLTNLANPKAVVFFGALFASLLPHHTGLAAKGMILVTMLAMALAWFATVAFLAATPLITRTYRRAKKVIDAVTGGLFIGLGGMLLPR